MNLLVYFLGLNIFGALAYFSDAFQKMNSKEKIPFKNYYFVSTRVSKFPQNISRIKRNTNYDECINLKFSNNDYKVCITGYDISDNGIVNEDTKFIVCNQNSTNTYKLNQLKINFVKGYIANKPYTSAFSGYVNNNNLYGKMEIDSKMFYIDPLDNFPSLVSDEITQNAIIYEIPLNYTNTLILHKTNNLPSNTAEKYFFLRRKRSPNNINGQLCSLMIIIDNSFLRIISKNNTKSAITTVLHSLDLVNALFRIADFDNDGTPDNIGFTTKYVIVLESEETGMNKLPLYTKHPVDGKLYLFFLSQYELLGEVCLGVAFTAQPFMHRVLGLSYTGYTEDAIFPVPSNNSGGICERPSRREGEGSFNNLVITYRLERDESVPQITSDLSLAHELGHSFGSDHDNTPECMGYLMAPHTSSNTYGHNFLFSKCSKKQINEVIKLKGSCLEISAEPFCGNGKLQMKVKHVCRICSIFGLVEEDEDCDCGLTFTCIQKDQCCIARNTKGPPCTINKNAGFQCHPSQGLCCMPNCYYRNVSYLGLNCENFSTKCPCENSNENCHCGVQGSCIVDECHSTECTRIGMKECRCTDYSKKQQKCVTCCLGPNGTCLPSKILTEEFAFKSEINLDKLKPYNMQSKDVLNINTETYEEYCVDSKCITLLFRTFNKGSFCLHRGQLGLCQDDYACNINTAVVRSKLGESAKIATMKSGNISGKPIPIILYIYYYALMLFSM